MTPEKRETPQLIGATVTRVGKTCKAPKVLYEQRLGIPFHFNQQLTPPYFLQHSPKRVRF
jgi:hypothetical protein